MTDCQKLADRCVRAGILDPWIDPHKGMTYYRVGQCNVTAGVACHDWRVVGAAIVILRKKGYSFLLTTMPDGKAVMTITSPMPERKEWDAQIVDDNDAIAILTACLDALEAEDD